MAGRGPSPKPATKRARSNSDPMGVRVVESGPAPAPELPEAMPTPDGPLPWPEQTLRWWANWLADPLAADFRTSDWDELLAAAVLHGRFWAGDVKVAPELRLRTAKFGATPEDRLRLRIQFSAADEADDKAARRRARTEDGPGSSRGRYKQLRAVE